MLDRFSTKNRMDLLRSNFCLTDDFSLAGRAKAQDGALATGLSPSSHLS
jgi:hypothetical protein